MMSMMNLGLTPDTLVHTLFTIFLCVLNITLLLFWCMIFFHQYEWSPKLLFLLLMFFYQQESIRKVLTPCILLALKFPIFFPKFQISFIVIVWLYTHIVSNLSSFYQNMIQCTPMGNIRRPYNYGSGGSETSSFIQCVNGREPQIYKLWCQGIDKICGEVHPYARIELPDGTVWGFVTDYISENGRRNQIIGGLFINGSVQFIGMYEIWGNGLNFISYPRASDCLSRWDSSDAARYNANPGSSTVIEIWGGSFDNSTVNWNGNWNVYVNASPGDSMRSPIFPRIVQHHIREDFLHCRHQQHLWCQFNHVNHWVCQQRQDRDFYNGTKTQSFLVQNSVASVSNCVKIACKINLCIMRGRCV